MKNAWVTDTGDAISDILLSRVWLGSKSCSINARLDQLHLSKTKLIRIFPSVSDIFHLYSDLYALQLIPDSLLLIFLLGCFIFSLCLPLPLHQAVMFSLVVAVILRDGNQFLNSLVPGHLGSFECLYPEGRAATLRTNCTELYPLVLHLIPGALNNHTSTRLDLS